MYERHRQKIAASYHSRMKRLKMTLDTINDTGYVRHAAVDSGVHTHLVLPEKLHIPSLLSRLQQKNIIMKEMSISFLPHHTRRPLLKLSVTRVVEDQIEYGIHTLFEEIKRSGNAR
jgi:DNA-binding transcriptional MocR family regulator